MVSDLLSCRQLPGALTRSFSVCRRLVGAAGGCLACTAESAAESTIILSDADHSPRLLAPGVVMPLTGLAAEACDAGRPLFSNRPEDSAAPPWLPEECPALENVLWAPMLVDSSLVGLVGLVNKPGGFERRDAELVQAYADVTALALLHSRRLEETACRRPAPEPPPAELFGPSEAVLLCVDLASGRIVDPGPAVAGFYGYPEDGVAELTLGDFTGRCLTEDRARLQASPCAPFADCHRLRSGALRCVEVHPAVVRVHGRPRAYCLVHDATGHAAGEPQQDERARFAALVTTLSTSFAGAPLEQTDELIQGALQRLVEALGADRASLFEYETEESLVLTNSYAAPGAPPLAPCRVLRRQVPWLDEQLRAPQALIVGTLDTLPAKAQADCSTLARHWLAGHLFIPLACGGQLLGVLCCGSTTGRARWDEIGIEALTLLAAPFGGVVARRQAHRALVERLRFEEVVTELAAAFASTSPGELERALDSLLEGMSRLLDCDRAVLGRLDAAAGGPALELLRGFGRPGHELEALDPARWQAGRLLRGEAVAIPPEVAVAGWPAERRQTPHAAEAAQLCVPVSVSGQVSHMLGFETVGRSRGWPEAVIRRVRVVADLVGKVIERQQAETAARELRDRLAHVARVMATGELAASFAHELNQPLTAIVGNARAAARFLAGTAPDLQDVQEILSDVTGEALRAGNIIAHMRNQLRPSPSHHEPLDVSAALGEVTEVLASEAIARRVDLHVVANASAATVAGDRVQIQQVIVNLVMNAFDAVGGQPPASRRVTVCCYHDAGTAVLAVEDTGHGLPAGRPESVFEPFVTTKAEGLGLGLSISRSIAAAHGGSLSARPREGGGARFELCLPLLPSPPEPPAGGSPLSDPSMP